MSNKNKNGGSRGSLLNTLAFWAVIFLALVMVVQAVLAMINRFFDASISLNLLNILTRIAMAIAIVITVVASYGVARSKGRKMFILWVVSAILVVLSYVLGITVL